MHIGTGGWDYFQVEGLDSLTAYSKAFDFVEVNSTFYSPPSPDMVRSWRRRVKDDFVFSVRCHRDLTHKYLLSPCSESYEILNYSLRICDVLKSGILHIQTPSYLKIREKIKDIRDLLSSFDFGSTKLAWEIRGNSHEATGLASLKIILEEDARFPAAKKELMEKQGWKVFDLSENEHVHARILLEKLPDREYTGVEEVIEALGCTSSLR